MPATIAPACKIATALMHEEPRELTAFNAEMEMLEDERYGDTGIDEAGTIGRY